MPLAATLRLAALTLLLSAPAVGAACRVESLPPAATAIIDVTAIDQGLFDTAMRHETNALRCAARLDALRPGGARLVAQTAIQSGHMARIGALTHENPRRGSRTTPERVKAAGIRPKEGSENIGMVYRFAIDGLSFKVVDAGRCRFSTWQGQPLGAHSYRTLARTIVGFWSRSSDHAKNLLNRRYTHVASAVAFEPGGPHCGRMWVTQTFYR